MNLVVSHWSASPVAVAMLSAALTIHGCGLRGLVADARRMGQGLPDGLAREAVVFYAGVLAVALALVSPVGYWAQWFVWVRSVQDLLLAVVAPALLVLGAPWLVLWRGLRQSPRDGRLLAGQRPGGVPDEAPGWLRRPVAAVAGFNVAWCGWHVPAMYDAAHARPVIFACEVITYLGLGTLFWLQIIGSWPHVPRLAPLRRVTLLAGTAILETVLAMVLVFGSVILYPDYRGGQHHVLSVVADQQLGGATLWVIMLVPYSVALIALLVRWLSREESAALATGLDRLLKPVKPAWPSRPGLRYMR